MSILISVYNILLDIMFFHSLFFLLLVTRYIKNYPLPAKTSNNLPPIDIIIPTYNESKNIEGCLESISSSDYPKSKINVYIVDDGSTDQTLSIVRNHSHRYHNLHLLKAQHRGKVHALNFGIRNSSSPFFITLDADTHISPFYMKQIIAPFTDPIIGCTHGVFTAKDPHNLLEIFQDIEYRYFSILIYSYNQLTGISMWPPVGSATCFRRDIRGEKIKFSSDTMSEDLDFILKLFSRSYRAQVVPTAVLSTKVAPSIVSFISQRTRWIYGNIQALTKHSRLLIFGSWKVKFIFANFYYWLLFSYATVFLIFISFMHSWPTSLQNTLPYLIYNFSFIGSLKYLLLSLLDGIKFNSPLFASLASFFYLLIILASQVWSGLVVSPMRILLIVFLVPYLLMVNFAFVISPLRFWGSKKHFLK